MQHDPSSNPDPELIPTSGDTGDLPLVPTTQGDLIFDAPPPTRRRSFGVKRWLAVAAVAVALGAAVVVGINAVPTLAASITGTPTSGMRWSWSLGARRSWWP